MRSIFIHRPGSSAMRVRVFTRRPHLVAAVRGMRRQGRPAHEICSRLGLSRERYDRIVGPLAFFKI